MLSHHGLATACQAQRNGPWKPLRRSSLPVRAFSPPRRHPGLLLLLVALLSWASLLGSASAAEARAARRYRARPARLPDLLVGDTPVTTWKRSSLLIDTSEPPLLPPLMPPAYRHGDATRTTTAPPSKRSLETDPKASSVEIPRPFDSALSNNFTSGCATFFKTMLQSDTVTGCHPFSLMLQTSNSLFQASKSLIRITQTLEATCAANMTQCLVGTDDLAHNLLLDDACKIDYDNNNPQVVQAYNGLLAYEPLYLASCLRDDDGSFCYADAVTNTTSEGVDAVPFYLPLGVNMPGGSRPTCNSCLQDEMAIFSSFAGNSTQPVSKTYSNAANTITMYCGSAFVNVTAAPLKGAASTSTTAFTPMISLLIMLFFFLFQ